MKISQLLMCQNLKNSQDNQEVVNLIFQSRTRMEEMIAVMESGMGLIINSVTRNNRKIHPNQLNKSQKMTISTWQDLED